MTPPTKKINALRHEKSPYLLQHATNPVNWYPWGETAFNKAIQEQKPIFLSIGYSTCHWCHVMAHESFEDPEVAKLLNTYFVNIKVDREERPDIDNLYMSICNLMTGSGGWPLTIIMTPHKEPFFAATYLPKKNRFGRTGLLTILPKIYTLWTTQPEQLQTTGKKTLNLLTQQPSSTTNISEDLINQTYTQLLNQFDTQNGGFGTHPKFPTPHYLLFLLRYWHYSGNNYAKKMVETTLTQMRLGGIYDHIGFGFHRYSTDAQWKLPHFEKMLYDQALLAYTYTEAYQATKNPLYKQITEEIFTYLANTMFDPAGGFYTAEDADSEGIEGRYYTWTYNELESLLTKNELNFFLQIYNIKPEGNYAPEMGQSHQPKNILHQTLPLQEYIKTINHGKKDFSQKLEKIRIKLTHERKKRIPPLKDDKILTDWNGLTIAAFAKAARAFKNKTYEKIAETTTSFIQTHMLTPNGTLYHRFRQKHIDHPGYADDYVFLIWGLLELYQTTFNPTNLDLSIRLNTYLLKHFWDTHKKGFFFTSDTTNQLPIRKKIFYDGAYPSANSIAIQNLLILSQITGNPTLKEHVHELQKSYPKNLMQFPSAYTQMITTLFMSYGKTHEIIIVGKASDNSTVDMVTTSQSYYLPNAVVILKTPKNTPKLQKLIPFIQNYYQKNNRTTAYICTNQQCQAPITDTTFFKKRLTALLRQKKLK